MFSALKLGELAGILPQQVKLWLLMSVLYIRVLFGVPDTLFPTQFTVNAPLKTKDDGPSVGSM